MSKQRKTVASTYLYDPLDRLAASNSIQRFYNDTRIATEIEGERKSRFFETDSQPLALQQHGSLPGTTLLATDQQTSVLNGVSPEGALHAQAYSPFGHHPIGTSLNGAGFNGERPEPVTGHYLLGQGYRAFNPVLMRFNSPDSWSPFGEGGINAYAYCTGDPVNQVDPSGHYTSALLNFFSRIYIRTVSKFKGSAVKKAKNVTRLSEGIVTFEDTYHKQRRLNFIGHGDNSTQNTRMFFNDHQAIDASSLHTLAVNNGYSMDDYSSLRTIMCFSGNGNANSFAAHLSAEAGRPVKSYIGTVTAVDPDKILPPLKNGQTSKYDTIFLIDKNRGLSKYLPSFLNTEYNPVTYGSKIRNTA